MNRIVLNNEQKEYLKSILADYSSKEVVNMIYEKYNILLNPSKIKHYRERWNIKRKNNPGRFKKGIIPHNKKEVGYEFTSTDGYTFIKVAQPNLYKEKQRYIYEKYKGEIPKGYSVVFLDQNKTNFNIDNLILVKRKDLCTTKNLKLITKDKDLNKIGLLTGQLINKNSEIRKNNNLLK